MSFEEVVTVRHIFFGKTQIESNLNDDHDDICGQAKKY